MPQANPQKSGAHFNKWVYNNATFTSNTTVKSDITVTAAWNCVIKFNGNGGTVNGAASKTVAQGSTFNFNSIGASRSGYKFNGWYSGSTKYSGNQTINSNITVSANWSCTHPARYEERTGAACTGGTIYYKCTQCGANLGSANYGGIGHSWTARCNIRHNLNWFDGRNATNGCGLKHTPGYSFCIVCEHCSALRGKGYNWCASSHVLGNTGGRPKRYPGQHNYYLLGGEEF